MSLHTDLPIYKTGCDLLSLAIRAQEQMPRGVKRNLGDKVISHCTEMLDLMAMANATQRHERVGYLQDLLKHQRAAMALLRVAHGLRHLSNGLWAESMELLTSLGKQCGGWIKSAQGKAPAA